MDKLAREIEPRKEGAQTWRRLEVTFPPSIANHNATLFFYYDEHGVRDQTLAPITIDVDSVRVDRH